MQPSQANLLFIIVITVLVCVVFAGHSAGAVLHQPRFVLNRSLFLHWQKYNGTGFERYEIHRSTAPSFTPNQATLIHETNAAARAYLDVRGLEPDSTFYFRLRTVANGAATDSPVVSARTAPDGNSQAVQVLMYHHVQPRIEFPSGYTDQGWVTPKQLSDILRYFKHNNYNCITPREYFEAKSGVAPMPPNPVMLIFDDGYKNFMEYALPILLTNDCIATCAIVTSKVGQESTFSLPDWPAMPLMNWDEIRRCRENGIWIGSHSQTHPDLRQPGTLHEIAASRDDIINRLGEHPLCFIYPYGRGYLEADVIAALQAAGYTTAFKTFNPIDIPARLSDHQFRLPRYFTYATNTLYDLVVRLGMDPDLIEPDPGPDPGNPGSNPTDRRIVLNDYNGDRRSDLPIFDPVGGFWYVKTTKNEAILWRQQWGWPTAIPVPGDYDGDERWDLAVFGPDNGSWYIRDAAGNMIAWADQWGWRNARPVPGDYDGDGVFDEAVFDTSGGYWYVKGLDGNVILWANQWGWNTAVPVPGDYDGDGACDQAVYDNNGGHWFAKSVDGRALTWARQWGWRGANPVAGDFDGDGRADYAVYDPAGGYWYVLAANGNVLAWAVQWGWRGAVPLSGDFDGDGLCDLAVWDPVGGNWYVYSLNGNVILWADQWGWPTAAVPRL